MANKPMPSLRNGPTPKAAASFVEGAAAVLHIAEVRPELPPPALESEPSAAPSEMRPSAKPSKRAAADKRRMTIYLSKGNAKKLALRSVHDERDMSELVEEALTAFFEKTK